MANGGGEYIERAGRGWDVVMCALSQRDKRAKEGWGAEEAKRTTSNSLLFLGEWLQCPVFGSGYTCPFCLHDRRELRSVGHVLTVMSIAKEMSTTRHEEMPIFFPLGM